MAAPQERTHEREVPAEVVPESGRDPSPADPAVSVANDSAIRISLA